MVAVALATTTTAAASVTMGMGAIKNADRFTIYASNPPYASTDVLLAPKDGAGTQQGLTMTVVGQAGAAINLGINKQAVARADGVATFSPNRLGVARSAQLTAVGLGAVPLNRLGVAFRVLDIAAGLGHLTASLGLRLGVGSTATGVGHMTSAPVSLFRLAMIGRGVGDIPLNQLGAALRLVAEADGVGSASAYLGVRVGIALASSGQGDGYNTLGVGYPVSLLATGVSASVFSQALMLGLVWEAHSGAEVEWSMPILTQRYGNLLRYFFMPVPDAGQVWPRRERYAALSNTP